MTNGRRIRVNDYHSLELEKIRLRGQARSIEQDLDRKMEYLREHYGSMAFHSILPEGSLKMESIAGIGKNILGVVMGNKSPKSIGFGVLRKGVQILAFRQILKLFSGSKSKKKELS